MPSEDVADIKTLLDRSLYPLTNDPEALAFFKQRTGIQDDDALEKHILRTASKAYEMYKYPCIWNFGFLKLKISRLPAYPAALKLSQQRKDAILLDIGCCFGNDAHKAAADGWPAENIVCSDLRRGYWEAGHELFKTTPTSFPATFLEGDVFEPEFLALSPVDQLPTSEQRPSLSSLISLNPLKGHVSAIHASSFIHLFSEDRQKEVAIGLVSLLLPEPGSVIFGSHRGNTTKGYVTKNVEPRGLGRMFCHNPESWKALWIGGEGEEGIFREGEVRVDASLSAFKVAIGGEEETLHLLTWSVTRL